MLMRVALQTSEYLERMGHHGTFTYGRLQFELENAIKRYERLSQDDDYGSLRDDKIKKPKAKGAATAEGLEDDFSNQLFRDSGKKVSCTSKKYSRTLSAV